MILVWSTTIIPQARPPPCDLSITRTCKSATSLQFVYLCLSLGLISIGAGGIRSSSLAFGANQLENGDFREPSRVKQRYFSWYYASYTFSIIIALTCVVYIQDRMGWGVGFAVPAVLMFLSVVSFFSASPLYVVKLKSGTNLITSFIQVAVGYYRNRAVQLSEKGDDLYRYRAGSAMVSPSRKLRFLNKACVVRDPQNVCTIEQVEEVKALIKVIPIWSTGMIMFINICQSSFPVLQAASMDRRIASGFTIPAASFTTFMVVSVILWITLYDRVVLPLSSRLMGRPVHFSARRRMGAGIFLSFLAMVVTAVVERRRRGLADMGQPMCAMWLLPQHCLNGFAEAANVIAQIEFYYSELPASMSSVASTLSGIGVCVANLLASLILSGVDGLSRRGGRESWISSDVDKGRYDCYYLVLAGLSVANLVYFVLCSNAYGPSKDERKFVEECEPS